MYILILWNPSLGCFLTYKNNYNCYLAHRVLAGRGNSRQCKNTLHSYKHSLLQVLIYGSDLAVGITAGEEKLLPLPSPQTPKTDCK